MDTTLEEVFLKVSEEDQSLENSDVGMGGGGAHDGGAGEGLCAFVWARWLLSPCTWLQESPFPRGGVVSSEAHPGQGQLASAPLQVCRADLSLLRATPW